MATRKRQSTSSLVLMTELAWASYEVIARRTAMMASGTCSPAEHRRMVREKAVAMQDTATLLRSCHNPSLAAVLRPWHSRARANAKRLRKV